MRSAADSIQLSGPIGEHPPPRQRLLQVPLQITMPRRRTRWLDWLRALIRWPMAPWRGMIPLLNRVAHLEAVLAGQISTVSRLQGALDQDSLTSAYSRLYFMAALRQEVARFVREDRSPGRAKGFVVGLLDLDRFKWLNDHFGHAAGDDALIRVVAAAQRILRRDLDVFARYGGDEFLFLLPQTSLANAYTLADKLRAAVSKIGVTEKGDPLSASIGLAACPTHGAAAQVLLDAADRAMYRAKRRRNAVCIAEVL